MAFDDTFRLSSHAVILNEKNEILLLKATYGNFAWGLPGGALEVGETIHEALIRECFEELNQPITDAALTGVYYHKQYNSQAFIFRCTLNDISKITLSNEHSEYKFAPVSSLSEIQGIRVSDCLNFSGIVTSRKF
ncbi:NUDIX domain-containing protein [Pseudomonas sp. DCB_AW]|uniref:NUDIX hydrolase n=1 Tax=Pseudomonas sp. DCB_AW TaxID=2993596 RepID=UPI00224997D2|nr:NUDIX domain-containing protein [Pseudomonas sp. DCB_AW]MCX2685893.1 NUDIX domain-containing protein [Pseudomonas sp. DCB_AW]